MMIDKFWQVQQLNILASQMRYPRKSEGCNFYAGDLPLTISAIAQQIIPYGKVALFYTKTTFEKVGKSVSTELKKHGIKIVNVLLNANGKDAFASSQVFNLPEDVRMVFAMDTSLFDVAKYYCAIHGVECGLVINSPYFFNGLSNKIFLSSLGTPHYVDVYCKKHVIIDFISIEEYKDATPYLYARLVSALTHIADYRISCTLQRKPINKRAYELLKTSATAGLKVMQYSLEERFTALLYFNLIMELASNLTSGMIINGSALTMAEWLTTGRLTGANAVADECSGFELLSLSKKILGVYTLLLSGEYKNVHQVCDYTERVEFLSKITGADELAFLRNYKKQVDLISCSDKEIKKVMDTISKQVLSFYNAQNNFVNIYYALGGKGEKTSVKNGAKTKGKTKTAITLADITAIKYSGDGIDALNGITLARELGFMDNPAFEI